MLKYCMRMQGVGFFVVAILCGLGLEYYMTNHALVQLDKETEITTVSGATFKVEKGWFVKHHDNVITLQDPDKQLSYSLVENQEKTAEQAVQIAWQKVKPDFDYVLKSSVPYGPKNQWEQQVEFKYSAPLQDDMMIQAVARLCNERWYITVLQSPKQTFKRRSAGLMLVSSSFKNPGFKAESFINRTAHILDQNRLQGLHDFIEHARIQCDIPGVAVGIVQDGKIIVEQGFGFSNLATQENVTPKTLFRIGSITKPLTTCMMAKLIDENFFSWNTPVIQLFPSFVVGDEQLTQKLKMIDMISNSNGMPQKGTENLFSYDKAPELRIAAMKDEKPTTKLGETFQYSNGMVAAGGYIAAHVVYPDMNFNEAYQAAMQKYVFKPLAMKSTTFDYEKVVHENHADPYNRDIHYQVSSIQEDPLLYKPKLPSGAAWSNIEDMNQYLLFELHKGINNQGQRIISEQNLLQRRIPQIKISDDKQYGLGFIIENLYGVTSIYHGGNVPGFASYLFFLPEHNIGCIILTNMEAHFSEIFLRAVVRKLMEILFDGKSQAQTMIDFGILSKKIEYEKMAQDLDFNPSSEWIYSLIGHYSNSQRGDLIIRTTKIGIELDTRLWKANLVAVKKSDGSLKLIIADGPHVGISLIPQEKNGQMELVIDEGQQKQIFKRVKL